MTSSYNQPQGRAGIREIQKRLRAWGADLVVDGVWGEETEAAFTQYGGALTEGETGLLSGLSPGKTGLYGHQYLSYTPPGDQALYHQAQEALRGEYDAMLTGEARQAKRLKDSLLRALSALEPAQNKRLSLLEREYDGVRQQLGDTAIKRGMGRSTHYLSLLADSHANEQEDAQEITQAFRTSMDEINREIARVEQDWENARGTISQKRESAIRRYAEELRGKRDTLILDMVKYNNNLTSAETSLRAAEEKARQQELERIRAAEEKSRLAQSRAVKSSSGRSSAGRAGSTGTGTAKAPASFRTNILTEWNRLTKAGKIATFAQIGEMVRLQNNSLYQQLKREVDQYKKEGIFAAVRTDYNFYKNAPKLSYYQGPR